MFKLSNMSNQLKSLFLDLNILFNDRESFISNYYAQIKNTIDNAANNYMIQTNTVSKFAWCQMINFLNDSANECFKNNKTSAVEAKIDNFKELAIHRNKLLLDLNIKDYDNYMTECQKVFVEITNLTMEVAKMLLMNRTIVFLDRLKLQEQEKMQSDETDKTSPVLPLVDLFEHINIDAFGMLIIIENDFLTLPRIEILK